MKQEGSFYRQREAVSGEIEEATDTPFLYDYQHPGWQYEKITPRSHPHSLISRIVLAIFSVLAVFIALETTLTIHGILYDNNVDPGSNTHLSVTIVFVLFLFFVVFANILYNRKQR